MRRHLLLFLLAVVACAVNGQQLGNGPVTVRGTVTDTVNAEPMAFVVVCLKGTHYCASTDMEGRFEMRNIPAGTYSIVVSALGFDQQRIPVVDLRRGVVHVGLPLVPSPPILSDGYPPEGKPIVDGSTSTVTRKQIRANPRKGERVPWPRRWFVR